jgi:hypothetical protein
MGTGIIAFVVLVIALAACILASGGVDADLYKYCVYHGKMFDEKTKEWVSVEEWKRRNEASKN